jgi:DNA repair exonuclease SbcCD ATPase subunit
MSSEKIEALRSRVEEDKKSQQNLNDYLSTQHEKQKAQRNVDVSVKTLLEVSTSLIDRCEVMMKTHDDSYEAHNEKVLSLASDFQGFMKDEAQTAIKEIKEEIKSDISQSLNASVWKIEKSYDNLEEMSHKLEQQQSEMDRMNEQLKNDLFLRNLIFKSFSSMWSMIWLTIVCCFALFVAVFSAESLFTSGRILFPLLGFLLSCSVVFIYLALMSEVVANKHNRR